MHAMRLISMCALLAALLACGKPNPRGYANPGVPASGSREAINAPYYTGADPSFRPRSGGGS